MSRRKSAGSLTGSQPPVVVATPADLAHQGQVVRVWIQRLADELVGDVGTVELGGVDVVDAELDRPPQHRQRLVAVPRRPEHAGPGQLHCAEADAGNGKATEWKGIHGVRLASSVWTRFKRLSRAKTATG